MSYIQLNRESHDLDWILNKRPTAFLLLTIIAKRAKRTNDHPNKDLEIGEAFIGDYESYGVTKQVYRSDKKFLQANSQVTLKVTNKGTIAKLISSSIFDINESKVTNKLTHNQHTTNTQLTPNKNDNNDKNEKKTTSVTEEAKNYLVRWNQVFGKAFVSTKAIEGNLTKWLSVYKLEEILEAIEGIKRDKYWKDKDLSPEWLLRTKQNGEEVDLIGRMLNNPKQDFSLGVNFNSLSKKNDSNT